MTRLLLISAAACAVIISGVAAAQMGPMGQGARGGEFGQGAGRGARAVMMLGAADYNNDNSVTRTELEQLHAEEFAFRDRNGDGFLDQADASPTRQRMAALRGEEAPRGRGPMSRLDANDDGRISRAEFVGRRTPAFDRLDADGDDRVTASELDAALEARSGQREARFWWRG